VGGNAKCNKKYRRDDDDCRFSCSSSAVPRPFLGGEPAPHKFSPSKKKVTQLKRPILMTWFIDQRTLESNYMFFVVLKIKQEVLYIECERHISFFYVVF